jgi:aspartate ammonia-lyase
MSQSEFHARLETDPLGDVSVPAVALYGVQTRRALDSNLHIHPALITAYKLAQQAIDSGKSVREALGEANKPGKGSKYGSAN